MDLLSPDALRFGLVDAGGLEVAQIETPLPYPSLLKN
jgi:hypothetical protein